MTTMSSFHQANALFSDPEEGARELPDREPNEVPLSDAEEEEFLELWAADRGNQAA